jgi:hypothetical protein
MSTRNEPVPASEPSGEFTPLEIIRSETALSRYPIHNLSTRDDVRIEIRRKDASGAVTLNWEVSYNSRYGPPGRLAYKLDTIIVNRRIEEAGKPVPKMVRLGSLREIAVQINAGEKNSASVKRALLQNASAFINAKTTYRAVDRTERTLEAAFSRYSVIFTGETLPDGRKADAVYLLLNDIYAEVLNNAVVRPMDYDYLRELSPSEQRFYEIISYQIFPALKYDQRARMVYSEYCALSTQVRYLDFDHVKKQMYKVQRPHLRSGYITDVEYEPTVDGEGNPDWIMLYTPGAKARNEQLAFQFPGVNTRLRRETERVNALPALPKREPPAIDVSTTPTLPLEDPPETRAEEQPQSDPAETLVRHFYETFHKTGALARPAARERAQAQDLLDRLGKERAEALIAFAHREAQKTKFAVQTFGGILQYEAPAAVEYAQTRKKTEQSRLVKARQSHQEAFKGAYLAFVGQFLTQSLETMLPEVYRAFTAHEDKMRRFWKGRASNSEQSAGVYRTFDEPEPRAERFLSFVIDNKVEGVPTFWEWDAQYNPTPWAPPVTI